MIAIMCESLLQIVDGLESDTLDCQQGENLFTAGQQVFWLYRVLSGELSLLRRHRDGSQLVLHRATAGSIIAEASVFSEHYHCDAEVTVSGRIQRLNRTEFRHRITTQPAMAERWGKYLAQSLQHARLRSEILALKTVRSRLDAWIAASTTSDNPPWKAVAAEIGVSPEALYRELARRRDNK